MTNSRRLKLDIHGNDLLGSDCAKKLKRVIGFPFALDLSLRFNFIHIP
ncbi:MAG: hypothetical protein LBD69_00325 [Puniceicoccales bacterium]|jgi:hypothetical protein|nr:hypothetical protein [Puniceicoccales bacterium]